MALLDTQWCLEELHVVSRDTTDLVSGKPRLSLPVLWELRWSWGQGSNESRTLHPEALSIYRYVQSSWPKRIVYQVGFDREVSFSDPIIPMRYVLSQVIYCPHLKSGSLLNEFFEHLPVIKRFSFVLHGQVWSFSIRIYSWKDSLPASLGWWDQGSYNISKSFRPFPLSTFACDFIFHIWNLSWFMVQHTWKFEIFLS